MTDSKTGNLFGGAWTEKKLNVLQRYLCKYTAALNGKFHLSYIDGFAGSGFRSAHVTKADPATLDLFPNYRTSDGPAFLNGSAAIALDVDPSFDKFIFVEKHRDRVAGLRRLCESHAQGRRAEVRHGDANAELQSICKSWDSKARRAVAFLDPFGMQVQWSTLQAIGATRAMDLWCLFPAGIGVNRLLSARGGLPESWSRTLDLTFGTREWRRELLHIEQVTGLHGPIQEVRRPTIERIGTYFNDRLRRIFPGVADAPKVLCNGRGAPMFVLCFACGNPKGAAVALRIANHILEMPD